MIILFSGGTKHRQDADIERALTLYAEFKAPKRSPKEPAGSVPPPKSLKRS